MLRIAYTADGFFDFVKEPGRLAIDDGLETAVILSLFLDAPATDDELAAAGLTREQNRGWWANDLAEVDGDIWGSKLWLLTRSKRTSETLARANDYAAAAVAHFMRDGLAMKIPIVASWYGSTGVLVLDTQMYRPGDLRPRWRRLWNAQSGQLLET